MSKLIPRSLTFMMILSVFSYLFLIAVSYPLDMIDYEKDFNIVYILASIITNLMLYFVWSLIYFMYHYVENYNSNLRYEAVVNEIKLNNLKSQLNPHFIFNALNSIRALVDENPSKAKRAITQLSNILRNSLSKDKEKLVKFSDEIKTVKDYLDLESIRFEERLKTDFLIHPDSERFNIPPLMLQTLVENCIKHGISNLVDGGLIQISTDVMGNHIKIMIRNSGQYINGTPKKTTGYGIDNTKQRLSLIYGDDAEFRIYNENEKYVLTEITIPQKS